MDKNFQKLKILIVRHPEDTALERKAKRKDNFRKLSVSASAKLGSPNAFYFAFLVIILWGTSGPLFNFSDTWQLVINTGTTIITFLMVFVIQNTQSRDSRAVHLKLDELIKSQRGARTEFVDIEDLSDSELDEIQGQFKELHDTLIEKDKNFSIKK